MAPGNTLSPDVNNLSFHFQIFINEYYLAMSRYGNCDQVVYAFLKMLTNIPGGEGGAAKKNFVQEGCDTIR